jgi:hypothetical protein
MWRSVGIVLTDVTEERIASIFRVEEKRRKSARAGSDMQECEVHAAKGDDATGHDNGPHFSLTTQLHTRRRDGARVYSRRRACRCLITVHKRYYGTDDTEPVNTFPCTC